MNPEFGIIGSSSMDEKVQARLSQLVSEVQDSLIPLTHRKQDLKNFEETQKKI